ncbi:MAG: glycosyltransferase [Myxococcota bacterium]
MGPLPMLPPELSERRVALVHDWLVSTRGGESVLASLCRLFPGAPIHTLFHERSQMLGPVGEAINAHPIVVSPLQKLPGARRVYRALLPLMPYAIESFDFRDFDLVISSSHCVAKGIIAPPTALHVSYIHTPMRYAYEQMPEYFGDGRLPALGRLPIQVAMHHLRLWDQLTAARVDTFVANSHHVARRVMARYRREATVVHPPVDMDRFSVGAPHERTGRFLMVGAFAPYKRADVAVEAFNRLKLPLDIVGEGQDKKRLMAMAGPTIRFLGRLSDEEVTRVYRQARAFIFPGEEDFGITPLESMASGTPVIALGQGGALETVVDLVEGSRATGVLYPAASVEGLVGGVERFLAHEREVSPHAARAQAMRFARPRFEEQMVAVLKQAMAAKRASSVPSREERPDPAC